MPNGCGCKPNAITACAYDPNDRAKNGACHICTAKDLAPESEGAPSVNSVKTLVCASCKICLAACDFKAGAKHTVDNCFEHGADLHDIEACIEDIDDQCRADCHSVCRKL